MMWNKSETVWKVKGNERREIGRMEKNERMGSRKSMESKWKFERLNGKWGVMGEGEAMEIRKGA